MEALAEGRLHLGVMVLLAPHHTDDTTEALLAAATHQTKAEIEQLLAERFPRTDTLARVAPVLASSPPTPAGPLAPGQVEDQLSPGKVGAPLTAGRADDRPRVTPRSSQSVAVQFTLSGNAHEQLRYAQALLGHQVPAGDLAAVFERALDALIPQLERLQFAATGRPHRAQAQPSPDRRHIPAHIPRAG